MLPITGYCIEPMPSTFSRLRKFLLTDMQLDRSEVRLVHQAMGEHPGRALFINTTAGREDVGLSSPSSLEESEHNLVSVNVSTLDTLISDNGITSVELLSIDSEGKPFNPTVPRQKKPADGPRHEACPEKGLIHESRNMT